MLIFRTAALCLLNILLSKVKFMLTACPYPYFTGMLVVSVLHIPTLPADYIYIYIVALRPNAGHGLLILEVSRPQTTTHYSRYNSSGRVISSSQRHLPDSTQHSQQTKVHAPGGIRNHDLSRRAAADLRLRPCGHWDRHIYIYIHIYVHTHRHTHTHTYTTQHSR